MKMLPGLVLATVAVFAPSLAAQTVTITAPPLFITPNEGRNPVGQVEGIEGGAYTARGRDVGAIVYNPAGLARSAKSSVSASAPAYDWTFYTAEVGEADETGSRISNNGRLFGLVVGGEVLGNERLSLGLAVPTPVSWRPTLQMSGLAGTGNSGVGMLFSADGSYFDTIPTVAAGYALSPRLRVGGSAGLSFLTLTQLQEGLAEAVSPTAAGYAQRTFRADGTSYDLLFSAGAQWDVTPAITVGLLVTSPGVHLAGTTSLLEQETAASTGGFRTATFRDPEAEFRVKHTTKASLGLSWRFERGEVEADVKYFAGTSPYEMFSSGVQGLWTEATPSSTAAGPVAFAPAHDERKSVTNVSVGGRWDVTKKTSLHLGLFTARSPVGEDSVFSTVDVYGASTGVSLNWAHLSGSVGVIYEWGSEPISVTASDGSASASGELSITSVYLLWGLSYKF